MVCTLPFNVAFKVLRDELGEIVCVLHLMEVEEGEKGGRRREGEEREEGRGKEEVEEGGKKEGEEREEGEGGGRGRRKRGRKREKREKEGGGWGRREGRINTCTQTFVSYLAHHVIEAMVSHHRVHFLVPIHLICCKDTQHTLAHGLVCACCLDLVSTDIHLPTALNRHAPSSLILFTVKPRFFKQTSKFRSICNHDNRSTR